MNEVNLDQSIELACRAIAPSWPLDRQIAVNPYWGLVDRPFEAVAQTMRRLTGGRLAPAADTYQTEWQSGAITAEHLRQALAEVDPGMPLDRIVGAGAGAGSEPARAPAGLPLLSDVLDEDPSRARDARWRDTITQQISQYCASYFDQHQADWQRAARVGLYADWRQDLADDHALEPLMHAPEIRARAATLPNNAGEAIAWAVNRLALTTDEVVEFLQVCLLRINGWASWCAYLAWEASLQGATDQRLRELLAIRVCWEALLDDGRRDAGSAAPRWRAQWTRARGETVSPLDRIDRVWLRAREIAYQDRLIGRLTGHRDDGSTVGTSAQLVFCIDVRSERFRRAIECTDPSIETRGFAGFFGLPIRYTPIGTGVSSPRLPGLIAPALDATDSTGSSQYDARIAGRRGQVLKTRSAWKPFLRTPSGAFSLVETIGPGFLGAILGRRFGGKRAPGDTLGLTSDDAAKLQPQLCIPGADATARKADLVASILRAMSLTRDFAPLLVLIAHGSQSANNPQSAALECGACGGHSGAVNARVLAGLLNDPAVRAALVERGIHLPASTHVVAALHNTTTDEVQIYDAEQAPATHAAGMEQLRQRLADAGRKTRAERAPSLGLGALAAQPDALLRNLRRRALDWSETRPEWGLADNAAFIVAPRSRTREVDLDGRAFLHDYRWQEDRAGRVLELIMTAPLIVTHWINLQYHASTVDPDRFGSGNKVLHNVACGRIGVFEGNTGDLRIGLSRQSLHDGTRWMHTPMRLSVFIEAPRDMIDAVLASHTTVRQLVENQWIHLLRVGDGIIEQRRMAGWNQISAGGHAPTAGCGD